MEEEKQNKKMRKFYVSQCKYLCLELPESLAEKLETFLDSDEREVLRLKLFEFYFHKVEERGGAKKKDMEVKMGNSKRKEIDPLFRDVVEIATQNIVAEQEECKQIEQALFDQGLRLYKIAKKYNLPYQAKIGFVESVMRRVWQEAKVWIEDREKTNKGGE